MTAAEIIGRAIISDRAGHDCAACRTPNYPSRMSRKPVTVQDGSTVLIMLCDDAPACCARYRQGLRPSGYAALLKRSEKP